MGVRAIGPYKFSSRSRAELYGDDQLVHVWWRDNQFLASAATFRVPSAIAFDDFVTIFVEPWAASDPDFEPGSPHAWQLDGTPIEIGGAASLRELEIGHKHTLSFQVG